MMTSGGPDRMTEVTIEYFSRADMTVLRKNGDLWRLRPDGQTQVMFDYVQLADEI